MADQPVDRRRCQAGLLAQARQTSHRIVQRLTQLADVVGLGGLILGRGRTQVAQALAWLYQRGFQRLRIVPDLVLVAEQRLQLCGQRRVRDVAGVKLIRDLLDIVRALLEAGVDPVDVR